MHSEDALPRVCEGSVATFLQPIRPAAAEHLAMQYGTRAYAFHITLEAPTNRSEDQADGARASESMIR